VLKNCLLKNTLLKDRGRIEVTGRRGRKRKQTLYGHKEKRKYWELKEEALDRAMWRTRFEGGYGLVVRQQQNEVTPFVSLFFGRRHPVLSYSDKINDICTQSDTTIYLLD